MLTTSEFLSDLFGSKSPSHKVVVWMLPNKQTRRFDDVDNAARFCELMPTFDLYFGVGLQLADLGTSDRGKLADITGIGCMWADIDIAGEGHADKKRYPPDLEAVHGLLAAMPAPPSIVVHSGHGVHAYWTLDRVWTFADDGDRRRAAMLARRWSELLKSTAAGFGWDVDSVHDLTRVLRLPGTRNWKDRDNPADVRVLNATGARYTIEQLAGWTGADLAAEPQPQPGDASSIEVGEFVLDEAAQPPFDKFQALHGNDPKFRATWERKRKDGAGWSASEYDAALAGIAVSVGWTDQEAIDLCIASRRKHGDSLKLRADYWARTLKLAHKGQVEVEALATLGSSATVGPADKTAAIAALSELLGLPVAKWQQHGRTDARYTLCLTSGEEIPIGTAAVVLSQTRFKQAVYDVVGARIPPLKPEKWHAITRGLHEIAELIENPAGSRSEMAREWLRNYLDSGDLSEIAASEVGDRLAGNAPFVKEGRLYVHADRFLRHIKLRIMENIDLRDLHDMLRGLGFEQRKVSGRPTGKSRPINRSYWRASLDVLTGPNTDHSEALAEPVGV